MGWMALVESLELKGVVFWFKFTDGEVEFELVEIANSIFRIKEIQESLGKKFANSFKSIYEYLDKNPGVPLKHNSGNEVIKFSGCEALLLTRSLNFNLNRSQLEQWLIHGSFLEKMFSQVQLFSIKGCSPDCPSCGG